MNIVNIIRLISSVSPLGDALLRSPQDNFVELMKNTD